MNKFFKLFSVVAALFLIVGLTGCFFDLSDNPDIFNFLGLSNFLTSEKEGTGKLLSDIDYINYISDRAGVSKVLDLNGHTITVDNTFDNNQVLLISGNLKIIDSSARKTGKIICQSPSTSGEGSSAIKVLSGGRLTVEAGTFESTGTGIYVSSGGTIVNMSGCNISAGIAAIINDGTIVTISGGGYRAESETDYVGRVYGLWNKGTIGTIAGGEFTATHNGAANNSSYAFGLENSQGEIATISGGTFTAVYALGASGHAVNSGLASITSVSGATFTPPLQ